MWRPLIAKLAATRTVIAPDLAEPASLRPQLMAIPRPPWRKTSTLCTSKLGYTKFVVGHDIGLMVAYAYAAQYPSEVERIALMDAFLPGIGNWRDVWLMRDLWHFHFYGKTATCAGAWPRANLLRAFLERFRCRCETFGARTRPSDLRQSLCPAWRHAQRLRVLSRIRAGREGLRPLCRKPLPMPMLVLTGEKASGEFLIQQGRLVAKNVEGVVVANQGTG